MPFRAAEGDELAKVAGRQERLARPLRHGARGRQGAQDPGIDPATIAHFYTFTWAKGSERSLAKLGTDGAIVKQEYATTHHLAIGGTIAITMPSGAKRTLVVRGIHNPRRSCWVTSA